MTNGERRRERTSDGNWFTLRRARTHAWILLFLLWGASAVNYSTPGVFARNGHVKGGDYMHFYLIGRFAAERRPEDIYDKVAQQREFAMTFPGLPVPGYLPFLYAPYVALVFAPLGALDYLPALLLWWLLSTGGYLWSCWVVWNKGRPMPGRASDCILFALAYPGFWELFIHGHTTWLALACFSVMWWALPRERWVAAGIALGCLAYKPQFGIAVLLVMLADRRWKVLLCASVTVALQVCLALALLGREAFTGYARMLRTIPQIARVVEPDPMKSCSVWGFLTVLGVPSPWSIVIYGVTSVALCLWLLRIWKRQPFDLAFAALVIVSILVAPHTTTYDLVLLAPAFILVAKTTIAGLQSGPVWPLMYAAYLLGLTRPLVAALHVQLATPVLVLLLGAALKTEWSVRSGLSDSLP